MSQPKRYFFIGDLLPGQTRYPHHHFVLYDDYAALAAEKATNDAEFCEMKQDYLQVRIKNAALNAKVDWLRKAEHLVIWDGRQWQVRHQSPQTPLPKSLESE